MKRKTAASIISFVLIVVFVVYFLWLASQTNEQTSRLGYYGIAASFVISLVPIVDVTLSKQENPNELLYRAQQLTLPLKNINSALSYGPSSIPRAVAIFDREIVGQALLRLLDGHSPKLVESLKATGRLVDELRQGTRLNKMGREAELFTRLEHDERAKSLVKEIQNQIQILLAKYGGK